LQGRAMVTTILQGAVATCGLLGLYYFFMSHGYTLSYTRTIVFIALLVDNVLLTLAGGRLRNPLTAPVLLSSVVFICFIYFVPFARRLFGLTSVGGWHVLVAVAVSLVSVGWYAMRRFFTISNV